MCAYDFKFARLKLHLRWPECWRVVESYLDASLSWAWDDFGGGESLRHEFIDTYIDVLSLYMPDSTALFEVVDAMKKKIDIPSGPLAAVLASSTTLRVLFASEALAADFYTFIARVEKAVLELEHHDFETSEYEKGEGDH
jgi:hypothetical protein